MWYIYYFDSSFCSKYMRCPGMAFNTFEEAHRVAAKARAIIDISYIVLPY